MDLGEVVTAERAEVAIKALDVVEAENKELIKRVKKLEFDCAELSKINSELSERVKKLASRQPSWPKGFRPQGRRDHNRRDDRR
jgi:predicted Mrr-cat superfamily restriction endonuclease|tara:strand:- start:174 stop:425 length:252 start_codon:yes stop_codon:yes gene_type:complete